MILTIAIISFLALGCFETWVFRQTGYEEDYLLVWISFLAAGFLAAILYAGAW